MTTSIAKELRSRTERTTRLELRVRAQFRVGDQHHGEKISESLRNCRIRHGSRAAIRATSKRAPSQNVAGSYRPIFEKYERAADGVRDG